tara:strand:+ start:969 stop:1631 length:663 start_codon:yes stop_codon:yes gene_type:complete
MTGIKILKIVGMLIFSTQAISFDGVWSGIFDINGHGKYDFTGLVSGKIATAYTEKAKVVYQGKFNIKEDNFKWNLSMYLKDGSKFGTAEIKGKIINENIMSGKWITEPAKDYGNIYLVKYSDNEILDASDIINKNWESYESQVKHNFLIKNFKIYGNDSNKCNYYGELINLNKKIYGINIEIASCGISDGIYNGMAHISKEKKLTINATNKNFSLFIKLN